MIKERLVSSVFLVMAGILCVVSYFLCGLFVTAFIIIALYEFYRMIEKKGVKLFKIFGTLVALFIPVSIFFQFPITEEWQFLFVVSGLFVLFLLELTRKKNYHTVLT